ncbi:shikimate kinase [Luteitalea sp.]|jgi:shikimate kinase|uniref:shikimate kinase n=1 Tax=Luteitalea sp. TaxID=2004800 RepID=UPI0037CC9295
MTGSPTDKLYLVGFMGSGKTTVARALSRRLGWRAVDLDEEIERREGQTVAQVFAEHGEGYFRKVEREVLLALLPARHVIVATGGGTFVQPANRADILVDGLTVWLDAPFARIVDRVPSDGRRPLASDREAFAALFEQRRAAYRLAHVRVDAQGRVDALVERILHKLGW